ncbi:MAG: gliding motility-associated ABC transporter permease subunit GldF [Flavobacteriaceae bacterium]
MYALIKREIQSFFASPMGYLVIGVFLTINGLFLWVFKGDFNIFDHGFADLASFFELSPWVLLFLIPAVTMKSFSDEKRMGTMELLLTKPLSLRTIVLGKYLGSLLLILMALLPTVLYVFTISDLGNPPGNWDVGSTLGSYLGLVFLALSYTAMGVFASSQTENQIAAFILGLLLCFLVYYGFEGLSSIGIDLAYLGLQYHFKSISRGVLDTRDLIYFTSVAVLFLILTSINLKKR